MIFTAYVLLTTSLLFTRVEGELQNCTSNICNLDSCINKTSPCRQICNTNQCKMSCISPNGYKCFSECKFGGCSKMFCDVALATPQSTCLQHCKRNCEDMVCKANTCFPRCIEDNCKMTCYGRGSTSHCYADCRGKGCEINVHSFYAEVICSKDCIVRLGKGSHGYLTCPGGNCTFICTKGTMGCRFNGACPNCTGPTYVDDPFATSAANRIVFHAFALLFLSVAVHYYGARYF